MTEQQSLEWDADKVMEQLIMQESRHMQMSALVSYQLRYPDMTIRDFFDMAARDLEEQEEELGYYDQCATNITVTQLIDIGMR